MLSLLIFLPLLGAVAVMLLPRAQETNAKVHRRDRGRASTWRWPWRCTPASTSSTAPSSSRSARPGSTPADAGFDVQYFVGVDGLSATMMLLTGLLFVVAALISWNVELRPREYFAWLLVLETAVMGVFAAQDLILFFLFWELELVPMFLLISIWGTGRKEYSAMKFVLYTLSGSALMLVGFLVLGFSAGTFDMEELAQMHITSAAISLNAVFFLILAAFAIKLPVFPLHTWLPDAHTDAPTAVSVILAGVLLKMGGYGLIRILVGILPDQFDNFDVYLARPGGGQRDLRRRHDVRQTDLKRLIAYSSVSHMGYVLLGVAALGQVGLTGAALQMFTHGTITALLFVMVGLVYDRTHTRQIADLGGLAHYMPIAATVFVIAGLASLGLPTMSGFVAELLVFLGSFDALRSADDRRGLRHPALGRLHPLDGAAGVLRAAASAGPLPDTTLVGAAQHGGAGRRDHRRRHLPGDDRRRASRTAFAGRWVRESDAGRPRPHRPRPGDGQRCGAHPDLGLPAARQALPGRPRQGAHGVRAAGAAARGRSGRSRCSRATRAASRSRTRSSWTTSASSSPSSSPASRRPSSSPRRTTRGASAAIRPSSTRCCCSPRRR